MSFGCQFAVDDLLFRQIDGLQFPCIVLSLQPGGRYRLQFLDDYGIEDSVAGAEVAKMTDDDELCWRMKMLGPQWTDRQKVVRQARVGDFPPGIVVHPNGATIAKKKKKRKHLPTQHEGKGGDAGDGKDADSSSSSSCSEEDGPPDPHDRAPKVIVHQLQHEAMAQEDGTGVDDMPLDPAYTIQGDTPLPRGGGLKALRALRK